MSRTTATTTTKNHQRSPSIDNRVLVPDLFYLLRRCLLLRTTLTGNAVVGSQLLAFWDKTMIIMTAMTTFGSDALVTEFLHFLSGALGRRQPRPHVVCIAVFAALGG